jgi:starch phosphorylase
VTTHVDPVCGMPVTRQSAVLLGNDPKGLWFCSEFCRQQYLRHPAAYVVDAARRRQRVHWESRQVAYFSMEVALANEIPTYAGGLGVLAGDTLRSCADLCVPVVGVSLVHRRGYFRQELYDDWQTERDASWEPERLLHEVQPRAVVTIEGREIQCRAWSHDIVGSSGYIVPVLLLDTDVPENGPDDRHITDHLYGGDTRRRLMQEIVLGVG